MIFVANDTRIFKNIYSLLSFPFLSFIYSSNSIRFVMWPGLRQSSEQKKVGNLLLTYTQTSQRPAQNLVVKPI